uniref:Uncharacterized protein n=1 Tax=Eutreptiella gymnastica TaxID=73025 RepID=A0A7S1IXP5_9EUGL
MGVLYSGVLFCIAQKVLLYLFDTLGSHIPWGVNCIMKSWKLPLIFSPHVDQMTTSSSNGSADFIHPGVDVLSVVLSDCELRVSNNVIASCQGQPCTYHAKDEAPCLLRGKAGLPFGCTG